VANLPQATYKPLKTRPTQSWFSLLSSVTMVSVNPTRTSKLLKSIDCTPLLLS
jgi:hypothetical protein